MIPILPNEIKASFLKKISECPLSKTNKTPSFNKSMSEYDKPLAINCEKIKKGLTEIETEKIKTENGWPSEITDNIDSPEQAVIYQDAGLNNAEINGRRCLIKNIDYEYVDEKTGKTNKQLMELGRSPIDSKTGEKIELHHMGQSFDAPFAELTENREHGGKNHCILHDNSTISWRNDSELKNKYTQEKIAHWKTRAKEERA